MTSARDRIKDILMQDLNLVAGTNMGPALDKIMVIVNEAYRLGSGVQAAVDKHIEYRGAS